MNKNEIEELQAKQMRAKADWERLKQRLLEEQSEEKERKKRRWVMPNVWASLCIVVPIAVGLLALAHDLYLGLDYLYGRFYDILSGIFIFSVMVAPMAMVLLFTDSD